MCEPQKHSVVIFLLDKFTEITFKMPFFTNNQLKIDNLTSENFLPGMNFFISMKRVVMLQMNTIKKSYKT
jgi:hypothetical protein